MTCGEARYICALNGGILAYVYSPEHLEILQGYLRTFIVRQNHVANPGVYSWVGLRYSSKVCYMFRLTTLIFDPLFRLFRFSLY